MAHPGRRRMLGVGLAGGALFLPSPFAWVWAQSEGTVKLLKAPKVALVVGNGKYKDAPELKNPPNDAKAIGEALKGAGFEVTMKLDTGREELVASIRDYVHAVEQKKCVGLFYFAGHGVQREWRNYMLPIDAVIDTVEDIGKQSVDIARLMEGLTKAANPMNVIILDACREDPFAGAKKPAQKGLSQMDAPTQTILAYATSPGNVASDGDGANGLYTENLLREMKVPEAKLEDVFKRVRLAVRRKTNGAQIPWESTSLEEDFWFIPPKELKKISDAEKDRLYKEQAAQWDRLKASSDAGSLADFLARYPNGDFSELAQLRLDRVLAAQGEKKVEIAQQAGNPYTKGSARANTAYKVGDQYTYRVLERSSRIERTNNVHVVEITDDQVKYANGGISDLLGNPLRLSNGVRLTANQIIPTEFAVGKRWVTRYTRTLTNGEELEGDLRMKIVSREKVTVPAGTFDAFRVEGEGDFYGFLRQTMKTISWYDPERVRREIAGEIIVESPRFNRIDRNERTELIAYKQD